MGFLCNVCWGQGWYTNAVNSERNGADNPTEQMTRPSLLLLLLSKQRHFHPPGPLRVTEADKGLSAEDAIGPPPGGFPEMVWESQATSQVRLFVRKFTLQCASGVARGHGENQLMLKDIVRTEGSRQRMWGNLEMTGICQWFFFFFSVLGTRHQAHV